MEKFFIIVGLVFLSGMFGRMGGAGKEGQWYQSILNTKWRDFGCPLCHMALIYVIWGYNPLFWWVYILVALFNFGAMCTYWDKLFGYDCHWFSGVMVGLASYPLVFIDSSFYIIVLVRAVVLGIVWHSLTKLPKRVLIWRQDVAEECCRYAASV